MHKSRQTEQIKIIPVQTYYSQKINELLNKTITSINHISISAYDIGSIILKDKHNHFIKSGYIVTNRSQIRYCKSKHQAQQIKQTIIGT